MAEHVKIKCGKGERYVIITEGRKLQYKGGGDINKNLGKKIIALYNMSDKSSNKKDTIKKHDFTHDLIQELQDLNAGKQSIVQNNLEQITVKQAITLIQLNVRGKRLALTVINIIF